MGETIPTPGATETRIGELEVGVGDRLLRNQNEYPDETEPMFNSIRGNVLKVTKVTPGVNADVVTESGSYGEMDRRYGIPEARLTREWFEKLAPEVQE